ncbi:transposase family protein [Streptomyces sp. NBC_01310]|uniref:transposase family protein n=1 Tax=Streptomyces sp. NBC_01310 TaxID=2903820 RepID=UPI0035B5DD82|nr:transposase family protein [Streptomyces sp. NBC_01310]
MIRKPSEGCDAVPAVQLPRGAYMITPCGEATAPRSGPRAPSAARTGRFIFGKNKQNAIKATVLTDASGGLLFCSPAQPASCADITHARQSGLVKHLTGSPAVEVLADAHHQGLGA